MPRPKKQILLLLAFLVLVTCFAGCQSSDRDDDDSATPPPIDDTNADDSDDDTTAPPDDDSFPDDNTGDDTAVDDDSEPDDDTVLDPLGDADRDGVSNGDEIAAGTDQLNPADAPAWHPEITAYPRLILDRAGWEAVRGRILEGQADYVEMYGLIRAWADMAPPSQPAGSYDPGITQTQSLIARASAFVAFVDGDAGAAAKAVAVFTGMEVHMRLLPLSQYDMGTINGGGAMLYFSHAYDMLAGFGLATPDELAACATRLRELARQLHGYYVDDWPIILRFTQNNHNIRFAAGTGAVGITLNSLPEAARYVNWGVTESAYFLLEWQNCPGGCQAEGPGYFDYSAACALPFFMAYHNFAQGAAFPYRVDCVTRFYYGCIEENVDVADPMTDPRLVDVNHWRLAIVMPSGMAPPIDDANFSCGYPGLVAGLLNDPVQAWLYEQSPACRHAIGALALEQLAVLDRVPAPAAPAFGPSLVMPDAGQAVLRDGWDADAFYALVIGEHGVARVHGVGHEQPDATAFLFNALDEMFALDSGYISFHERLRVANAWNHNLVLADGAGPPTGVAGLGCDADAWLSDFIDDPPMKWVRVRSAYAGIDVDRLVGLVPGLGFFTIDRIAGEAAHDLTWQFHANAGGTTDGVFTLEAGGARVERPLAVMSVRVTASPSEPAFEVVTREHGYGHDDFQEHDVLQAELSASNAVFLSAETVAPAGEEPAAVTLYRSDDGTVAARIAAADGPRFVAASASGALIELPAEFTGARAIESDAAAFFASVDPESGEIAYYHADGGTYVRFGDDL